MRPLAPLVPRQIDRSDVTTQVVPAGQVPAPWCGVCDEATRAYNLGRDLGELPCPTCGAP